MRLEIVDTSLKRSGRVRVTAGASGGRLGGDWGVPAYGGVRDIGAYLTDLARGGGLSRTSDDAGLAPEEGTPDECSIRHTTLVEGPQ